MDTTAVTLLGAGIGAAATIGVWLADQYEIPAIFRRTHGQSLTGTWSGWSIYVPVDGFFSRDNEAIYETTAEFRQHGRRVTFTETLTRIYAIDGTHLAHLAPRHFRGRGKVGGGFDI